MKDQIYHACQLAVYGIYEAGGDETPEPTALKPQSTFSA